MLYTLDSNVQVVHLVQSYTPQASDDAEVNNYPHHGRANYNYWDANEGHS